MRVFCGLEEEKEHENHTSTLEVLSKKTWMVQLLERILAQQMLLLNTNTISGQSFNAATEKEKKHMVINGNLLISKFLFL